MAEDIHALILRMPKPIYARLWALVQRKKLAEGPGSKVNLHAEVLEAVKDWVEAQEKG